MLDTGVRSTELTTLQVNESVVADEEKSLTEDIISLASEYGRHGYRRITECSFGRWLHEGDGQGPEGACAAIRGKVDLGLASL